MALAELTEKGADVDVLRQMVQFMAPLTERAWPASIIDRTMLTTAICSGPRSIKSRRKIAFRPRGRTHPSPCGCSPVCAAAPAACLPGRECINDVVRDCLD